jgi:hypothetical protein
MLLWAGWWYLNAYWYDASDMGTRGQFGDLFGGVNALFTGLAFAALIYTLILQRKELDMQREELRRSVEAQQGSQEALTKQVEQLERSSGLSAMSTLVAAYGRELNVIEERDRPIQKELAAHREKLKYLREIQPKLQSDWQRYKDDKAAVPVALRERIREVTRDIPIYESRIAELESVGTNNAQNRAQVGVKHERLVNELEEMVREAVEASGKVPSESRMSGQLD